MRTLKARQWLAVAAVGAASLAMPGLASATSGTATIAAGSLSMTAPATLAFSGTVTGADQVISAAQAIDVLDNTGSGAGWNVTLTSTQFVSGANTLPVTSATDIAATGACDASVTCTTATNSVNYPLTVPAAATAPTAVKIFNAALATGLGPQTWTNSMNLALLGSVHAGTYTSTWTYSLVTGP